MSILNDIRAIGLKMKNEQASLKEIILESSQVDVSDEQVDGLDRLIYNHCLNKKLSLIFLVNQEIHLVEFFPNCMKKCNW